MEYLALMDSVETHVTVIRLPVWCLLVAFAFIVLIVVFAIFRRKRK